MVLQVVCDGALSHLCELREGQAPHRLVCVALMAQPASNALLQDAHLGVNGVVHCRQTSARQAISGSEY